MQSAVIRLDDVLGILGLLEDGGIAVWLNGGWGVDALLGAQTRNHADLDITVSSDDRADFEHLMRSHGYGVQRVDNEFNWVLVDAAGRHVDVHLVDLSSTLVDERGHASYGPRGLPFEVGSLDGVGTLGGVRVRCETAAHQVRGHTGYPIDVDDAHDVLALCRAFALPIPDEYVNVDFR